MGRDIEKRIIDFIKESPLGTTSSEIAKFLGINRATITKYLAIVREKAKIDFKQFGMAKLWYIPVDINQIRFLKEMLVKICQNINAKQLKDAIDKTSTNIGKDISEIYKRFHGVNKLTKSQLTDSIIDAMNKLGGNFSLVAEDGEKITLKNSKCLFGPSVKQCPMLCIATSNIIGTIVAENIGYGKVELRKTIAKGNSEDTIIVHLKK